MANARGTIDMKGIKAASQQATNYIKFDNNGITVADLTNGTSNLGKNVFINSTSVNIRNGTDVLSSFTGDGVYIGESDKASLSLTSSEISATTNAGVEFFNIASGTAYEEETISGSIELTNSSSSETVFSSSTSVPFDIEYETAVSFTANIGITVDGASSTREFSGEYTYSYSEEGTVVDYGTQGVIADAYSMTFRYGTVIGENIINLKATITPVSGHTAIIDSVTFNYTATSRKYQSKMYTFGTRGEESDIGEGSFTVGDYMIASSPNQFVIGKYNVEDANSVYAFIIGNGSDIGEYRSNAFAVKWSGDVETNAITLNENSLSEADNYIECVNANDAVVFKVVKSSGNTVVGGALVANSTATFNGDIVARSDLSVGDALTVGGAINAASNTWNVMGDDIQVGDINESGALGIQGLNGNTAIRFTTYGQSTKTTGGKLTWDGSKFISSSPFKVTGALTATGELNNGTVPIFKTAEISFNCGSINANASWSQTGYGISHSNYRAIAIAGFKVANDSGWCVVPKIYIHNTSSGDTLDVYIWNQKESQITGIYLTIKLLYIATTALDTSYLQA